MNQAQKTHAPQTNSFLTAPLRAAKSRPLGSIAIMSIFIMVIGVGAAGVGIYSLLSQGVVNAALGQTGGLVASIGGGVVGLTGFAVTYSMGALKAHAIRRDRMHGRSRSTDDVKGEGQSDRISGNYYSGIISAEEFDKAGKSD